MSENIIAENDIDVWRYTMQNPYAQFEDYNEYEKKPVRLMSLVQGKLILAFSILIAVEIIAIAIVLFVAGNGSSEKTSGNSSGTSQTADNEVKVSNELDSYRWLLEPSIEAINIDVLRCGRADAVRINGNTYIDQNAIGSHKYDDVSLIVRDEGYGLIEYGGGTVIGVDFDNIEIGYDKEYLITKNRSNKEPRTYLFTDLNELERTYSPEDVVGTSVDDIFVWVDGDGLYLMTEGSGAERIDVDEYTDAMAVWYATKNDVEYYDYGGYREMWINSSNDQVVLINNGKLVDDRVYDDAGSFSDGIIPVKYNGKWGYVDTSGNIILPFEFDGCWEGLQLYDNDRAYNASDGYIAVSRNGEYAMFNTRGQLVISYGVFDEIRPVYEGMCWVKRNGRWGVIAVRSDASNTNVIPPNSWYSYEYDAKVNTDKGLRMREGPGTKYKVTCMLSYKTKVEVCGQSGDWVYICYDGLYGWASDEYLDYI